MVRWLDLRGVLFCSSSGGENKTVTQAMRSKRQGYRKGAPDLWCFTPPPRVVGKVGFALEMKPADSYSKGTVEQREWLRRLSEYGWLVGVFKGAQQAIYALEQAGY